MNNLTRPFLPRGILTDDAVDFPEPVFFGAKEICAGYWRVRRWLLTAQIKIATQPSQFAWEWSITIPIVANNMRRLKNNDTGAVDIVEQIPQDELALTPTVGTIHENIVYDSSVNFTFESDPPVKEAFESAISADIYSLVWRQWQKNGGFNTARFVATGKIIILGPDGLAGPTPFVFIGLGTGIGDTPLPVPWECGKDGKIFAKNLTAAGSTLFDDEFRPADITGSKFSLSSQEFWEYGGKFDAATGEDNQAFDDGGGD
jgi:hypothetical protein